MMIARVAARAALGCVLCVLAALSSANAQNASPNLKEVQIPEGAFSLGDPVPPWVEAVAIPQVEDAKPVVVRLADAQWLVGETPTLYVHRAVMVNDAASLTSAGQLSISFVPQYQRLQLHAVRVLRDGKSEDRTASSTIRFLQRETGLEQGVYSGIVTVSILVNDLRVGDTTSSPTRYTAKIRYSEASSLAQPFGIRFTRRCFDAPCSLLRRQER